MGAGEGGVRCSLVGSGGGGGGCDQDENGESENDTVRGGETCIIVKYTQGAHSISQTCGRNP